MADRADLTAYEGKPVVLGVRPEDLHTEPAFLDASRESVIELHVDLAELMGAEIYLYGDTAGVPLTVRAVSYTHLDVYKRQRLAW